MTKGALTSFTVCDERCSVVISSALGFVCDVTCASAPV